MKTESKYMYEFAVGPFEWRCYVFVVANNDNDAKAIANAKLKDEDINVLVVDSCMKIKVHDSVGVGVYEFISK